MVTMLVSGKAVSWTQNARGSTLRHGDSPRQGLGSWAQDCDSIKHNISNTVASTL